MARTKLPRRVIAEDLKTVSRWIAWARRRWDGPVTFWVRNGIPLPESDPQNWDITIAGLRRSAEVLTALADYMEREKP